MRVRAIFLPLLFAFTLTIGGCSAGIPSEITDTVSDLFAGSEGSSAGSTAGETNATDETVPSEYLSGGFWYNQLSAEQQSVYADFYNTAVNRNSTLETTVSSDDDISYCLTAMMNDHPEIFWLDGSASYSGLPGSAKRSVTLNYNVDVSEIDGIQEQIDAAVNDYLATLSAEPDEYEIVRRAYRYIIANTDYDSTAPMNQNIQSVFLYDRSVCSGYAKAFMYLVQAAGIEDVGYVTGTASYDEDAEPEGHSWNVVAIDGTWTLLDVTWGDPTYAENEGDTSAGAAYISYDYLCLTEEELTRDGHTMDSDITLPDCSSTAYDYYRYVGAYFEYFDYNEMYSYMLNLLESGDMNILMKFSNADSFDDARRNLFEAEDSLMSDVLQEYMSYAGLSNVHYEYTMNDRLYIIKITVS